MNTKRTNKQIKYTHSRVMYNQLSFYNICSQGQNLSGHPLPPMVAETFLQLCTSVPTMGERGVSSDPSRLLGVQHLLQ